MPAGRGFGHVSTTSKPLTAPGFLQLGAGDTDFKVVSALLPEKLESWMGEEREEVTFYPFVVVLETSEGKQFCWMPNLRICWGTQSHASQ